MSAFYKLDVDGKTPIPSDRMGNVVTVKRDEPSKDVTVSTVFLGLDHNFGDGPPLLFETMIFGGPHADFQARCSTWSEAEKQHADALRMAK